MAEVGRRYRLVTGDGRSTEDLVEAGDYAYAHSCVTSENFPMRHFGGRRLREIVLLEFDRAVSSEEAIREAARRGLERPMYEDALYFGAEHPEVQRERPVVFLHDPWFGFFGRRDVLCLWSNAGRRELGLDGFDDAWTSNYRFAFVAVPGEGGPAADRDRELALRRPARARARPPARRAGARGTAPGSGRSAERS